MDKEFNKLTVLRIQAYYATIAQMDIEVRDLLRESNSCEGELKKFLLAIVDIKKEEKKAFEVLLKRYEELEENYKDFITINEKV